MSSCEHQLKLRHSGRRCKLVQACSACYAPCFTADSKFLALCQPRSSTCLRLHAQQFATSRFLMDSNLNLTNTSKYTRGRERERNTKSFKLIKYIQCCCHVNSSSYRENRRSFVAKQISSWSQEPSQKVMDMHLQFVLSKS